MSLFDENALIALGTFVSAPWTVLGAYCLAKASAPWTVLWAYCFAKARSPMDTPPPKPNCP